MGIPFRHILLITASAAQSDILYEGLRQGGGMPPCQTAATLLANTRLPPEILVVIDCATFVTARSRGLAITASNCGCGGVILANASEPLFADLIPQPAIKGVLTAPVSTRTIQRALAALGRGELCFSRQFMSRHMDAMRIVHEQSCVAPELTSREWRVLALISEGHSNASIADQLNVSPHTVKTHTQNIFRKTGAANRTQAAQWARNRWPATPLPCAEGVPHETVGIVA